MAGSAKPLSSYTQGQKAPPVADSASSSSLSETDSDGPTGTRVTNSSVRTAKAKAKATVKAQTTKTRNALTSSKSKEKVERSHSDPTEEKLRTRGLRSDGHRPERRNSESDARIAPARQNSRTTMSDSALQVRAKRVGGVKEPSGSSTTSTGSSKEPLLTREPSRTSRASGKNIF